MMMMDIEVLNRVNPEPFTLLLQGLVDWKL
jgi:hypothetical protein